MSKIRTTKQARQIRQGIKLARLQISILQHQAYNQIVKKDDRMALIYKVIGTGARIDAKTSNHPKLVKYAYKKTLENKAKRKRK